MACLNKDGQSIFLKTENYEGQFSVGLVDHIFSERIDPFFENIDYYYFEFTNGPSLLENNLEEIFTTEALDKIRNENIFLICKNKNEAFTSVIEPLYEQVIMKYQINPNKLILLTNSQNIHEHATKVAKKYDMPLFQIKIICECERAISNDLDHFTKDLNLNPEFPKIENIKKCFLNFNRRWRPHRPALVALMKIRNLLDKGYVSLTKFDNKNDWNPVNNWGNFVDMVEANFIKDPDLKQLFLENKEVIKSIENLTIDVEDLSDPIWYLTESTIKYYHETYFSIVSEPYYYRDSDEGHCIHFSEKTFKPIAHKHPFIIVSSPYSLRDLKRIGYKTFHPYIDESYDDEEDDDLRMIKIVNEIERLCNLSQSELKNFLDNCQDICEYNYNFICSAKIWVM